MPEFDRRPAPRPQGNRTLRNSSFAEQGIEFEFAVPTRTVYLAPREGVATDSTGQRSTANAGDGREAE